MEEPRNEKPESSTGATESELVKQKDTVKFEMLLTFDSSAKRSSVFVSGRIKAFFFNRWTEKCCIFNSVPEKPLYLPEKGFVSLTLVPRNVSPNHVEKHDAPRSVGRIRLRGKILQSDWLCRNSCNGEQMACRQCTRPSPAPVAISRIEKAWLREARLQRRSDIPEITSLTSLMQALWRAGANNHVILLMV